MITRLRVIKSKVTLKLTLKTFVSIFNIFDHQLYLNKLIDNLFVKTIKD
jgi:hypothetical protein